MGCDVGLLTILLLLFYGRIFKIVYCLSYVPKHSTKCVATDFCSIKYFTAHFETDLSLKSVFTSIFIVFTTKILLNTWADQSIKCELLSSAYFCIYKHLGYYFFTRFTVFLAWMFFSKATQDFLDFYNSPKQ